MAILDSIKASDDIRKLQAAQLPVLANELRQLILSTVSRTGGHLASNLGAIELTISLLRVFSPPHDKVLWDVGHQAYAWKILTGRQEQFASLRQFRGLSGFPKPSESPCDTTISGHAGVALSAAIGMAVARDKLECATPVKDRSQIIAIVGDGCMTNGISLEALNNLIESKTKLIVILNDNEMSISKNVGALSRQLGRMLVNVHYNRIKRAAESAGHKLHMTFLRGLYHRLEQAIKSIWLKNAFFEEFGLRYVGPIDGHDFKALQHALQSAAEYPNPVLIHVATVKGKGFPPAEKTPAAWHGVGAFDRESNEPLPPAGKPGFSEAFGKELVKLAEEDKRIIGITAAMKGGTGLNAFAERFPDRFYDVGICEEHATVFAAGLAAAGLRPFFAVYSTFLQRAIDCVMHDVCIANLPVVFCIDRAGSVGRDGPTHHGMFDIALLRPLPNLSILQPKDPAELAVMMRWALRQNSPVAIRYPKETDAQNATRESNDDLDLKAEVICEPQATLTPTGWIWALGTEVGTALRIADILREKGIQTGVVNARFVKPIDHDLLMRHAKACKWIATLEDGSRKGGFGSEVCETLSATNCRVFPFGWPDTFIPQGSIAELRKEYGLTPEAIAQSIQESLCGTGNA